MHECNGNINNTLNNKSATTNKLLSQEKFGVGVSSVHDPPETHCKGICTIIYGGSIDRETGKLSRASKFRHQTCTFAPRTVASGTAADMMNNLEFVLTNLCNENNIGDFLYIKHITNSPFIISFQCFLLKLTIRILFDYHRTS